MRRLGSCLECGFVLRDVSNHCPSKQDIRVIVSVEGALEFRVY